MSHLDFAAIAGNATIGGKMKIRGNTTISRNLRVEGWLDAPNIKGPLKGWFRTVASLEAHYRAPVSGWLAIVGDSIPGPVYIAENGRWVLTESTGGQLTVEAGKVVEDVETLTTLTETTNQRVDAIESDLTVLSKDNPDYELAIGDEEGNLVVGIADGHIRTANFDSSALREDIIVAEIRVADDNEGADDNESASSSTNTPKYKFDSDFVISDEKGNVIVSFADGHIRTRLFDSSEVATGGTDSSPTRPLEGKILSILGDSISTYSGLIPDGYPAYYPKGDVNGPARTYWSILARRLGLTIGANCSWSGSYVHGDSGSTTSAVAGCSSRRIADLASGGIPDYIIVYIGINDFNEGTPLGDYTPEDQWITDSTYNDFTHAYARMLQKLMTTYPKARIIVCTLMDASFRDSDGVYPTIRADGSTLADFNRAIRGFAEAYGLTLADLHSCGIHWANMADYYHDSALHPNAAGHRLMAQALLKTMNSEQ